MKTCFFAVLSLLCMTGDLLAHQSKTIMQLETGTGTLEGSLILPDAKGSVPVALIIAGSGPTDRDGNNPATHNNSLKMLAEALAKKGIASLRYDKRGVGKSQGAGQEESELRFEHYISDANAWVSLLKKDNRFKEVIIIGHSEGSLIGMVAARKRGVDKFISIAGAGLPADMILSKQLRNQPPEILNTVLSIIDKLRQGERVEDVNPVLDSLFRPSVQPYLMSWFKYDPGKEIARLDMPVLIIQGLTDLQVSKEDAIILARSNPNAELKLIKGMNHILKDAEPDRTQNIATYNQPDLPINPQMVNAITDFIMQADQT